MQQLNSNCKYTVSAGQNMEKYHKEKKIPAFNEKFGMKVKSTLNKDQLQNAFSSFVKYLEKYCTFKGGYSVLLYLALMKHNCCNLKFTITLD